jgi:hypothetical protein
MPKTGDTLHVFVALVKLQEIDRVRPFSLAISVRSHAFPRSPASRPSNIQCSFALF